MTDEAKKPKAKMDPKLLEMMERAANAQKQARESRKAAPGVDLQNPMTRIPQKDLFEKYAKRDGFKGNDDPDGNHYMCGDRELTDQYPDEGYVPVLDRSAGGTMKQVTYRGDPMWSKPTDLYRAQLEENARRARRTAQGTAEAETESAGKSAVSSGESLQVVQSDSPEAEMIRHEAGV